MTDAEFHAKACGRKKNAYATKRDARKHARWISSTHGGPVMREYACPGCGFYHLTSDPNAHVTMHATASILEARRAM